VNQHYSGNFVSVTARDGANESTSGLEQEKVGIGGIKE